MNSYSSMIHNILSPTEPSAPVYFGLCHLPSPYPEPPHHDFRMTIPSEIQQLSSWHLQNDDCIRDSIITSWHLSPLLRETLCIAMTPSQ
mmetsp:Transcript_32091/g.65237  ORF Transcript_32091/g.65237 Transcript_32091/m.65237 type:complete len:89 (-) Transcript_32091:779-1045(-)